MLILVLLMILIYVDAIPSIVLMLLLCVGDSGCEPPGAVSASLEASVYGFRPTPVT